jgi:hypothetical protein
MKKIHQSLMILGIVSLQSSVLSQNLLSNGSFELGNVGFFSGYTYAPSSNQGQREYALVSNPRPWNPGAFSMSDHTSGTGLMLAANGSSLATDILWRQVVSVQPNTTYLFGGWDASWGVLGGNTDPSPANLRISINGLQLGDTAAPSQDGQWHQFSFQWLSGAATQASIEIRDLNTAFLGNDFALDDMTFAVVPEPSSALLILGLGSFFFVHQHVRKFTGRNRS